MINMPVITVPVVFVAVSARVDFVAGVRLLAGSVSFPGAAVLCPQSRAVPVTAVPGGVVVPGPALPAAPVVVVAVVGAGVMVMAPPVGGGRRAEGGLGGGASRIVMRGRGWG
jgi:hypothetical protein